MAGDENCSARLSDEPPCLLGGPGAVEVGGCTGIRLLPPLEWVALAAVLIFGEIPELRHPDRGGYGDIYYAAAVRSGA
ncbi:hypothetical protein FF36_04960 [Frankia torreyi]|uniref:Uncharacterized protein n=1 Tax=Frankia torreyi TaxID=1856 RepID=A0A0D8BA07_9ACTN|nr:hypothetical protein FF36_04960 [Frankia torreyi]KQM03036.1 hypothetical protein FF86_104912 [Frankia sp. CpI1-P]